MEGMRLQPCSPGFISSRDAILQADLNLFYWNNIVHDLTYQYGFDEPARNFQGDNLIPIK